MPVFLLGVPIAAALAWIALKGGRGRASSGRAGAGGLAGEGLAPGVTGELGEEQEEEPFKRRELRRRGGGGDDPETYGNEVGGPYGPAQGDGGSEGVYTEIPAPTQSYVSQLRNAIGQPDTTFHGSEIMAAVGPTRSQPFVGRDVIGTRPAPTSPTPIPQPALTPSGPLPTSPTSSGTYSFGSVKAV